MIVLEGLDGVGKSTLAARLAKRMGAELHATPNPALRAMRADVLGALGPSQTARALFYASTVISLGEQLAARARPAVVDRYWLSTLAYATARGGHPALDRLAVFIPPPDVTVLVTLSDAARAERLHARGMSAEDVETLCPRFARSVLDTMRASEHSRGLGVTWELAVDDLDPDQAVDALVSLLRA